MKEEEIEKLIHMNQRLNLILGYAMGFIKPPMVQIPDDEVCAKYNWLIKAIENICYLDKPLPPLP